MMLRKANLGLILGAVAAIAFALWYVTAATRTEMVIPILKADGTIGAGVAMRGNTLLATLIKEIFNRSGVLLTFWSDGEEQVNPVKIGAAQPEDSISWRCPAGTSIPAYRAFSGWDGGSDPTVNPPTKEQWGWGPYVGGGGPQDEGVRLARGDPTNDVFPDVNNGPTNKFFGYAGPLFSFVNRGTYVLTEGRYYASARVDPGQYNFVRCRIPSPPVCGDRFTDPPEECDGGNTVAGDGCGPTCLRERCGNGFVDPGEPCDDGNTSNTDACRNGCVLNTCVDGFVNVGVEQCDDGMTCMGIDANGFLIGDGRWCAGAADCASQPRTTCAVHNGDGCTTTCTVESLHVCELRPDKNPPTPERSLCTFGAPTTPPPPLVGP